MVIYIVLDIMIDLAIISWMSVILLWQVWFLKSTQNDCNNSDQWLRMVVTNDI